jgi:MoaA/NifB/PqqE/SkfB family radical SAM enzyme
VELLYKLNKTSYQIFKSLQDGLTIGEIALLFIEWYDITEQEALKSIDNCIKQFASPKVEKNLDRMLLSSPFRVGWNITNKCNLNCLHCYTQANETDLDELDTQGCLQIIAALKEAQILDLVLTGGEPFARPDFEVIFNSILEAGFSLAIFTNATLVKKHIDVIRHGWARYLVSLDGLESTHDKIRGKGAFQRAVEGVRLLKEANQHVTLNVTLTPNLLNELDAFLEFVYEDLDVNIQLGMMLPIGRAIENEDLLVDVDMYSRALKIVMSYSNKIGETVSGIDFSSQAGLNTLYMNNSGSVFIGKDEWQCNAGYSKVTIRPNGDVYPCAFSRDFRMGNLSTDLPQSVWQNPVKESFLEFISGNRTRICNPIQKQIILRRESRD